MGKFDGILICTDLDGTLLRKDKTVSSENIEAIEHFKKNGGYFTFVTGRMPFYTSDIYNMVRPNVPFGCVNGGGLYDHVAEKYVYTTEISRDVIELAKFIDENIEDVGIHVNTFYNTYFCKENDSTVKFRRITGVPKIFRRYDEIDERLAKIIFGCECAQTMAEIEQASRSHPLADKFEFVRSARDLFEVLPKGVDKSVSMIKLAEHLNLDMSKTIAVGDYDNDASMIKAAGLGVAVKNASQKAKEAADIITVSNEEHAIAKLIYDIESGDIRFKA